MSVLLPSSSTRLAILCLAVSIAIVAGGSGSATPSDVILRATAAPVRVGAWNIIADASAAGGSRLANPNAGAAKPATASATPASYFELSFTADAGVPYRLWMRGKAQGDSYENDSVYVQFSDSVTSAGSPTWRIGTTSSTSFILEDCSGCGVQGWGWQDNGYGSGVLGPAVYFAVTGSHTIRVQVREDGLSIDQIVLSPTTWISKPPGGARNDTTILVGGTPPPAITLVREPYLQQVSDSGAILVWASREPGPAQARVNGQNVDAVTTFFAAATTGMAYGVYQHEATVTGLLPGTTYPYDVFVGGVDANSAADQLRTAPATGAGSVRFIVYGDSGTGSAEQQTMAALMNGDSFDLAGHTGDIAYGNGGGTGDATYATYHSWFFDVYRTWLRRSAFFPAPGNHDTRPSNAWGRAYLDLFVLPEDAGAGPYADHAERYYSYDYGPVHFVVLDTERAFDDAARRAEQVRWLDADLAASSQPWKIAYFHKSPFSSGEHGPNPDVQTAFGTVFERRGVQLVISGHDHGYERSVPWRMVTDPSTQAVTYMLTGGGGGPLYAMGRSEWTAASASRHNYVRTTVSGCVATIEAVGSTGAVFDAHTLDRCDQAADGGPPVVSILSPAAGATVSGTTTVDAAASDDIRVEKVDLWVDGQFYASDAVAPYQFSWNTAGATPGTHTIQVRAYDIDGRKATASRSVIVGSTPPSDGDTVIHVAHIPGVDVHGNWSQVADSTAADGIRLANPNLGQKLNPSATPVSYIDVRFTAQAGVPYHVWLRMKATSNSYENDSVSVQFDKAVNAAGAPIYRINTTNAATFILEEGSGANVRNWGWNDNGYGNLGPPIYFAGSGPQTLRIQVREDGVSIDQIVISAGTFLTQTPGALKDDSTIVPD